MVICRGNSVRDSAFSNFKASARSKFTSGSSKKGQVTVFIIIGILILFAFALILFLTQRTTTTALETELQPVAVQVPQVFRPVVSYTENCMAQITKQGLRLVGQQGGYIDPDIVGRYSATQPTEGDGLDLQPTKVPFWHYNSEPNAANKVVYHSLMPALYVKEDPELSIEAQVARYVEERINQCLNDFQPFKDRGLDVASDLTHKEVRVAARDGFVDVQLNIELELEQGDADAQLDTFYTKIPLDLKHFYETAKELAQAQTEFNYLEKQALELIAVYSRKDFQALPPTSDVGYEVISILSWSERDLQQKIRELLNSYVPVLQYLGSDNFLPYQYGENNILAQRVYDNMVVPLTGADDLTVQFDYFNWDPYFAVNSNDRGKVEPEHQYVSYFALNFGYQRYETHYDVSYPVLVTLKDDQAMGGEGYKFVMALESNVRNNAPAGGNVEREFASIPVRPITCDEEQRDTGLLKTIVVDSSTGEPVELAQFGFSIPNLAECDVGLSNFNGVVEEKYPSAYGGVINILKGGYLPTYYPVDTVDYVDTSAVLGYSIYGEDLAEAENKVIELHPEKEISLKVMKKDLQKCIAPLECTHTYLPGIKRVSCKQGPKQCFFNQQSALNSVNEPVLEYLANSSVSYNHTYYFSNVEKPLRDDQTVILTLDRVTTGENGVYYEPHQAVIEINGDNTEKVTLYPGTYSVYAVLTSSNDFTVPKDTRCNVFDLLLWQTESCFDFDGTELDEFIESTLNWGQEPFYITITPEDLYSSDEITFYTLGVDYENVPEKIETTVKSQGVPGLAEVAFSAYEIANKEDEDGDGVVDNTVLANTIVVEELAISGDTEEVARNSKVYAALQPTFE